MERQGNRGQVKFRQTKCVDKKRTQTVSICYQLLSKCRQSEEERIAWQKYRSCFTTTVHWNVHLKCNALVCESAVTYCYCIAKHYTQPRYIEEIEWRGRKERDKTWVWVRRGGILGTCNQNGCILLFLTRAICSGNWNGKREGWWSGTVKNTDNESAS